MRFRLATLIVSQALAPMFGICGAQTGRSADSLFSSIVWQGPGSEAKISYVARMIVPQHCKFTDESGVPAFLETTHNVPDPDVAGIALCFPVDSSSPWFVMFEYDPSGLVRDTDKNSLDAKKILASIRRSTSEANRTRIARGWDTMSVDGWIAPPFYDETSHNLTWALLGRTAGGDANANRSVRLLGRGGVIAAQLVADPTQMSTVVPEFDRMIEATTFISGQRYSEWRTGDKVAEYGLVALVAGGAGATAAKLGLLGKLWKLMAGLFVALWKLAVAIAVGFVAWIKSLFKKKDKASSTG
jgi:uncharacterized membrane-anchored protein